MPYLLTIPASQRRRPQCGYRLFASGQSTWNDPVMPGDGDVEVSAPASAPARDSE